MSSFNTDANQYDKVLRMLETTRRQKQKISPSPRPSRRRASNWTTTRQESDDNSTFDSRNESATLDTIVSEADSHTRQSPVDRISQDGQPNVVESFIAKQARNRNLRRVLFAGAVAYLLIFRVLTSMLPSHTQHADNNDLGLRLATRTPNTTQKTNILVAMAIDCNSIGNMNNTTRSVQLPATSNVELFWYFNIYNAKSEKCTTNEAPQLPRVRIAKKETLKNQFWLESLGPKKVQEEFHAIFDFVWMVDSDLLLEALNFGVFLDIIQKLDFGIAQPAILGTCATCRGSDHPHLNKISEPDLTVIAKTASIVEIMAPLMKFSVWQKLHPLLEAVLQQGDGHGPDLWWCGYVWDQIKRSKQNNDSIPLAAYPCGVVHATPLFHMNARSIEKGEEYKQHQRGAIRRQEMMYPAYFENAKELLSEQVFTVTDLYRH